MIRTALNVLSIAALVASLCMTVWHWSALPDVVPIHFGVTGQADGWGSKWWLVGLPLVATGLVLLLTAVERIPALSRKTWFTEEKNKRNFESLQRLMPAMRCLMALLFTFIQWSILGTGLGWTNGLNPWVMVGFVGGILVLVAKLALEQLGD